MKLSIMIAAALIFSSLLLFSACRMPAGLTEQPPDLPPEGTPALSPPPSQLADTPDPSAYTPPPSAGAAVQDGERSVRETLYFLTDEGYLLPVSARIAWEDGIARACLSRLIDSPENAAALALSGLRAPIPAGTVLQLAVSGGNARVDLIGLPALESAEREKSMFAAIVNTLTQFPSIDTVTVLIGGSGAATAHGVVPPSRSSAFALNAESDGLPTSGSSKPVTLFFPNGSASHFIPVTRYIEGEGLYAAISQLAAGTTLPKLRGCFPENTLVLGAAVENGVLTVDLSRDFLAVSETPGLYRVAMQSVLLTAMPYAPIDEVRFTVNNVLFEPAGDA